MKEKKNFIITGALFFLFATFTVIVKRVDVRSIGPKHSSVGLATLNQWVFDHLGTSRFWYTLTEILGYLAILTAMGFALLGLCQWVRRKSLLKVDGELICLGILYAILAAIYLAFEAVIVNYRPIILGEGLEASYPSSHTMAAVCIMGTAILEFRRLFVQKHGWRVASVSVSILVMVVTVVGRLMSGVHWFTDILAGSILSAVLIMLYYSVVVSLREKKKGAICHAPGSFNQGDGGFCANSIKMCNAHAEIVEGDGAKNPEDRNL